MNATTNSTLTEETADWINYYVRVPKHYGQEDLKRFDRELTRKIAAAITQDCSRGYDNAEYKPVKDGLYEVRLQQNIPMARVFLRAICQMFYAKIICMELRTDSSREGLLVQCDDDGRAIKS